MGINFGKEGSGGRVIRLMGPIEGSGAGRIYHIFGRMVQMVVRLIWLWGLARSLSVTITQTKLIKANTDRL